MTCLYLCLMGVIVATLLLFYCQSYCDELNRVRRRQQQADQQLRLPHHHHHHHHFFHQHAVHSSHFEREDDRDARHKYVEEQRAHILKLLGPVRMVRT
jgi:hypothetical protein